jgi:hypothetical protein
MTTTTFKSTTSTLSETSSFKVYYMHNQTLVEVKFPDSRLRAE